MDFLYIHIICRIIKIDILAPWPIDYKATIFKYFQNR